MTFTELALPGERQIVFGTSPKPVQCGFGLTIGGGQVLPEVNFTLPALTIDAESWSQQRGESSSGKILHSTLRNSVPLGEPKQVL
jgi:methanol--5-hydroxybenzimidazolylcobamide Co-methyltransferase